MLNMRENVRHYSLPTTATVNMEALLSSSVLTRTYIRIVPDKLLQAHSPIGFTRTPYFFMPSCFPIYLLPRFLFSVFPLVSPFLYSLLFPHSFIPSCFPIPLFPLVSPFLYSLLFPHSFIPSCFPISLFPLVSPFLYSLLFPHSFIPCCFPIPYF